MIDASVLATFTAHGGRVAAARAVFGGAGGGEDWIDLSTGIAPWAWPADAVQPALDRLPEPGEIAALEAAAAQAFRVADPARVVAVPGTDLAMRLLAPLLAADRPAVVTPGYAGHAAAWRCAAAIPQATAEAVAPHDLVVLASPANPDGRVTDPALLRDLSRDRIVVVDEAYADPAPGLCGQASDRLVVLRSFGKFYGLPGLRLGFVVAGPDVTRRLRAMLGDWPLSMPAIAIGTAAYRDTVWRAKQQARIVEAGAMLDGLLADSGLAIVGSTGLFRLVAVPHAHALFDTLARHAILTRPFADAADRLRIGLPRGAAALARLAAALESLP